MNEEIRSVIRILPFILVLLVLFFLRKKGKIEPGQLYLNKPNSFLRFIGWVFGFLCFVLVTEFILFKLGLLEMSPWNHPLMSSIIRIFGAVILAPVAEELIFRGLILTKLANKINRHLAVFIQAVFFVLLHNFAYENTVASNIGIVQTFTDALLFGYARYATKSIYTPITMHITGNIIATAERFIL